MRYIKCGEEHNYISEIIWILLKDDRELSDFTMNMLDKLADDVVEYDEYTQIGGLR